jgi:hypothetical protein
MASYTQAFKGSLGSTGAPHLPKALKIALEHALVHAGCQAAYKYLLRALGVAAVKHSTRRMLLLRDGLLSLDLHPNIRNFGTQHLPIPALFSCKPKPGKLWRIFGCIFSH